MSTRTRVVHRLSFLIRFRFRSIKYSMALAPRLYKLHDYKQLWGPGRINGMVINNYEAQAV